MRLEGSYAFDATLRETPTNLPKLPKLLFRNAEYAESAEYHARLLPFLGLKYPVSRVLLRISSVLLFSFTLAAQHAPRLIN